MNQVAKCIQVDSVLPADRWRPARRKRVYRSPEGATPAPLSECFRELDRFCLREKNNCVIRLKRG